MPMDRCHENKDGVQTTDDKGNPITFPSEKIGFVLAHRDMSPNKKRKMKQMLFARTPTQLI